MARIPEWLHEHIDTAFPKNVCLVSTASKDGIPSIGPKGSVIVYDEDTLAYWERAKRGTYANLQENPNVTIFFRNPKLREAGILPGGGAARFWGKATIRETGPERDKVWQTMVQAERDRDPEKAGFAVLVRVERAEHLNGKPLE